jgi:hypothetical protein
MPSNDPFPSKWMLALDFSHGEQAMTAKNQAVNWLLGLLGAAGGGLIGLLIFHWLIHHQLYGMVIPGAALGAGGGALFRKRSLAFGVVCAILAVGLGIFAEWWAVLDVTFGYLLTHLNQLDTITMIMIAVGAVCAFWFGQGWERPTRQP